MSETPEELRERAARLEYAADLKRLRSLRRRVDKVRDFPTNTCPASRHLHMIAEALAAGKPYHGCDWHGWNRDDQRWIAETMLATLESLWTLRRERSANPRQDCVTPESGPANPRDRGRAYRS